MVGLSWLLLMVRHLVKPVEDLEPVFRVARQLRRRVSRPVDAPSRACHDLDEIVRGIPGAHPVYQVLGILKAADDGKAHLRLAKADRRFLDTVQSPDLLVGEAFHPLSHDAFGSEPQGRLRHAARGAKNDAGAAHLPEKGVHRDGVEEPGVHSPLFEHLYHFRRCQDGVDVGNTLPD